MINFEDHTSGCSVIRDGNEIGYVYLYPELHFQPEDAFVIISYDEARQLVEKMGTMING